RCIFNWSCTNTNPIFNLPTLEGSGYMQIYLIGSGPFDPEFFKGYVERQKVAHNDSETAFVGVDLGKLFQRLKQQLVHYQPIRL
ncbi:hypothetical protein QML40_10840, partial [Aerococcus urinaeequi]